MFANARPTCFLKIELFILPFLCSPSLLLPLAPEIPMRIILLPIPLILGIFKSKKKYGLVMSYAIHRWVGMELIDYFQLLLGFKDASGFIIIESHPDESDKANLRAVIKSMDLKIISNGLTDDHLGYIREFFIVC